MPLFLCTFVRALAPALGASFRPHLDRVATAPSKCTLICLSILLTIRDHAHGSQGELYSDFPVGAAGAKFQVTIRSGLHFHDSSVTRLYRGVIAGTFGTSF